jgi:hypothetical protein
MASNEFYVKKDGDKIILTIVSKSETSIELDIEDAADLALDIQQYIQQYINKQEAKEQNDSKNKLSADMNKWINNHFGELYDLDTEEREVRVIEIEKAFGQVYKVDPITFKVTKQ